MPVEVIKVNYKPLWKLLVDKEISKSDLRKRTKIAPSTFTKVANNEQVSLNILARICKELECGFDDIVEKDE
ncbi:helix-turn-helix domain-containing protein [Anaeromicropila populeti]|uniref:DNA-binding transcriptional regulator, XRE family n=1 Tax=Anaeromicropila populeti TaxID=37658 RepID=A0A1I6M293_9FIRM|nr:helix-turn-helix transcriptional regulator [Anaeromicropila populeti]SFS09826.1 DNA-binding transcriptional regulator, XRE family [Anaeromicropila populeti]